ncbi:NADP-dependent malic enzyme, partial [Armadillidium vulgare]
MDALHRDRIGQRPYHEHTGDNICPSMVRGIDYLRDPRLNKGMAFTLEERQVLGIHGLIPPRFKTQEEQVELCVKNVARYQEPLNKYIYLAGLQDRNERLFYRTLSENVEEYMPIVYTPTVGLACQKFGLIFRRPRGLFISIHDQGHELLDDDFYIGSRHERITGERYDAFIDEFMQAVVQRYGQNTLIQFEDFGNHNAFRFLEKYREQYCTFNDDIQGTASVAVAGILASLRETKTKLKDHRFLFQGAGEASIGIANLIVMAMEEEGSSIEDARSKIFMVDSKGLIVKNRPKGGVSGHKISFAKDHAPLEDLREIVNDVKPTALIGAAAVGGVFTPELLKDMASFNDRPVIFALSNPTSKAECTAEAAYTHTDGRAVFASGSPFDPVKLNGRTYHPGQGNNAYIFPGVALGVICTGVHHIQDELFLLAAKALADMVTDQDLAQGRLYPPLSDIRKCSLKIATYIAEHAYKTGIASTYPEPKDKSLFIKQQLYDYNYDTLSALPSTWEWPDMPNSHK